MYDCRYLPPYADYLIKNHLEDYAEEIISSGTHLKLPLLISLSSRYSPEQIKQLSLEASREYLRYIADNKAYEQVVNSMSKWMKDQLEVVSKMEIAARDITLINYIRGRALK